MANRSRVIALSVNDLKELERLVRASSTPASFDRIGPAIWRLVIAEWRSSLR